MKSFVYIALAVFLATVAVQGYGPKINRKHHGGTHKSPNRTPNKPSHGSPHRPHHPPVHDRFGRPQQHGHWDNSPVWDYRSGSWDSSEDRGSGSYDRFGPDSSYSDSPERSEPSYEDYRDYYSHFHSKRPCNRPQKKPQKTTPKPIPTIHTKPPWTQSTRSPLTGHTQHTPRPTGTTAAVKPNPTTPYFTPRPTRTVSPTPRPIATTEPRPTGTTWHPTTPTVDTTHWETTTTIPETTTTEGEEEFTTISPEVQNCIDTCPSTPEFNPVCGTNRETYNNEGKLFCAASCGVNVTILRRSVCPPPIFNDYDEETPPTPPPTTTTPSSLLRSTPFSDFQRCMRLCHITASFTPVCGTDLVTYMNMDRLKCAQGCGEVVEVLCEKPCAACGFNPVTPKTTTLPPTTAKIGRTTLEPDIQECIDACPVTAEYNPVCGSDHVTYINPSHLVCAQMCGVGVAVVRLSPCSPRTTTSTTTQAPPTTLSPNVLSCIRRCPVTSEYDPVCGSNDLTYTNLGNLECSRFCGIEVELKHKSRCLDEFDLGTDSTPSQTTQDVKGNKDVVTTPSRSTETTTSLFTSRTTTPTTSLGSTLTITVAPISSSTLGFTIPPDILNDIFGSTLAHGQSTTKAPNSDGDEDIDLDPRFSNDTNTDKNTDSGYHSRIIFPD